MASKQEKTRIEKRKASVNRTGELVRLLEPGQNAFHQDIAKRVDIATNEDRLLKVYAQQPKKFHQIEEEEERKYAKIVKKTTNVPEIRDRTKAQETAEFHKKQMEEARLRDQAYHVIQKAQGELWREEMARQQQEDSKVGQKKKENQAHLKSFYKDQIEAKERTFVEQCALSQEEMKFQAHLM